MSEHHSFCNYPTGPIGAPGCICIVTTKRDIADVKLQARYEAEQERDEARRERDKLRKKLEETKRELEELRDYMLEQNELRD